MSWRENLQKLSHEQVREIVGLCAGAALLLAIAVFLSAAGTNKSNLISRITPASQTASDLSCLLSGGCSSQTISGGYTCNVSAPATFTLGQTITITWSEDVAAQSRTPSAQLSIVDAYGLMSVLLPPATISGSINYAPPGTDTFALCAVGPGFGWCIPACGEPTSVAIVPPSPTLTITGNGTNPTNNVIVGHPVTILATFVPGSSDTLTKSAINDFAGNDWCGDAGCQAPDATIWTTPPIGTKTYTFTPGAIGSYLFTPSVQTTGHPAWNNYSQSLTVNVVAQCPNGQGPINACTSCTGGFFPDGSGHCVAPIVPTGTLLVNGGSAASIIYGQTTATLTGTYTTVSPDTLTAAQIYNSTTGTVANSGTPTSPFLSYSLSYPIPTLTALVPGTYTFVARESSTQTPTLGNNSGSSGLVTLTVSCPVGQTWNGSTSACVPNVATITTFSANPTRVRKSTATFIPFTTKVTNPPPTGCTITGPIGFTAINFLPVDGATETHTGSVNISQPSLFTLTCGVGATKQITIGLVPTVKEI